MPDSEKPNPAPNEGEGRAADRADASITEQKPDPAPASPVPNPDLRTFVVQPAIGNTPGYIWVQNEDGGELGRIFLVRVRFGKEIERVRLTKHFKKLSAKQVRDEASPVIGDLLFNEREHGALSEETAKRVIEKALGPQARRPGPRPGPRPGGGRPGGAGPRPGGSRGPRGGPHNAPRNPGSRPPRPR
ncbi:MAG: hypothetical protein EA379_09925 [Phycisphaerales bacterium]|nr:MAG: hypothetical protein EA379_09925 [Phycisphaerales bacterium]